MVAFSVGWLEWLLEEGGYWPSVWCRGGWLHLTLAPPIRGKLQSPAKTPDVARRVHRGKVSAARPDSCGALRGEVAAPS